MGALTFLVAVAILLVIVSAVDRSKFRTCADTGFCRRHRLLTPGVAKFVLDASSVNLSPNGIQARILGPSSSSLFLNVDVYNGGTARVRISEQRPRWKPSDILQPSALINAPLEKLDRASKDIPERVLQSGFEFHAFKFSSKDLIEPRVLIIKHNPLKIEVYVDGALQFSANERNFMHFEMSNAVDSGAHVVEEEHIDRHGGKEVVDYGEDGLAIYADGTKEEKRALTESSHNHAESDHSESFGGHRDSMPRGPLSVGMDFSFPFAQNVYGLPEHSTPLSLPTTSAGSAGLQVKYQQPYRLYNLDVFEYELDETMALYGNVPVMFGHGMVNNKPMSAGIFWFNPSETFIDISDGGSNTASYKQSHWISESGEIDVFFFTGPHIRDVLSQFTKLVGRQQLPPIFSLGYHQCRWNYRDEKDVATVEGKFEELDYPMDVIWLDIEHTNGKRYFTWDKSVFPSPLEMQKNITNHGRKMVTIIDPHIKRDMGYTQHRLATEMGLYIKDKDGHSDYHGWCWPGESSYLDFTNPRVRQWWAEQFSLQKYEGSTLDLYTWNDMNEPSVFNGPEVSMPKDTKNLEGVEHREWHNLYGYYMHRATFEGQLYRSREHLSSPDSSISSSLTSFFRSPEEKKDNELSSPLRPFVLTRSFWAGSQRFGAMWTGDNAAQWSHLEVSLPMLLSLNLAGFSFSGADLGGFFGDSDAELFTRWYEAASFTPFFRGHAHHDSKRREPWVYGEPHTSIHRAMAMLRYSLLPYWYTVFAESYLLGLPVMRPLFVEYPHDSATWSIQEQFLIGDKLMVAPVLRAGRQSVDVYFPIDDLAKVSEQSCWYDLLTMEKICVSGNNRRLTIAAPLDKIPVFIRAGTVLPRKMRLRRSATLMHYDPLTLFIAPNAAGVAHGFLYSDDESTLAHEDHQAYHIQEYHFEKNELRAQEVHWGGIENNHYSARNTIERIVIVDVPKAPSKVHLVVGDKKEDIKELLFFYDVAKKMVTIKKPDVVVTENWVLHLI